MPALRPLIQHAAELLLAILVAGCATPPATVPGAPGKPGSLPREASQPTLADEHRRLRDLLDGTPVAIELTGDGRLRLEVPLRNSFDAGRAAVKPALAAVLDRLATGLRRQSATELRIAAPSDPGGSSMLAADRAASARDYLIARGVPAIRFVSVARGDREGVEIVVSERFTPTPAR